MIAFVTALKRSQLKGESKWRNRAQRHSRAIKMLAIILLNVSASHLLIGSSLIPSWIQRLKVKFIAESTCATSSRSSDEIDIG